ncbi:Acyl carrier protein 1, mitochondrial [Irineochytrium annulatum]|nr:Acyl carrier protein 1, mitochondrial [Irineochytrium annulatum]
MISISRPLASIRPLFIRGVSRTATSPLAAVSRSLATLRIPVSIPTRVVSSRLLPSVAASPLCRCQGQARSYSAAPEPLTVADIETRVLQVLKDFDKVDAAKLTLDSHFVNDLGLDSLDQVEITMAIEDEFNIELPDRVADEIFTPRQAVEKVFANKTAM